MLNITIDFVAALEWGERLGADVVSASLGYDQWYSWSDLNGKITIKLLFLNSNFPAFAITQLNFNFDSNLELPQVY